MTIIQAQPLKQFGISGPISALDNEVPVFDGITGKKIKAATGIICPSSGRLDLAEIRAKDGNGLKLYEDGGAGIFVKDGGNVGIGTTSPAVKLDIGGHVILQEEGDGRAAPAADTDPHLRVYSSDATQATDYVEMYHNQTYGNVYAPTQLRLTGGTYATITAPEVNLDATSADGVVKFKNNGTTFLGIAGNAIHEETRWTMNDVFGNMIIFTNYAFKAINHDHAVQINPTVFIHSDTNPNTNNTEWGSLAFIGTGSGGGYFNIANGVGDIVMQPIGNIGIGTTDPATSAKLELSSTTGALLLTRMTTAQRNALTAVNGMMLYDLTTNKFQGYENGAWVNLI